MIMNKQMERRANVNKINDKHRCKLSKKQRGYTLIELIIVMAIFAIVGSLIVTLMRSGGKFNEGVQRNAEAQNSARIAMSYINVKIRQNDSLPTQTQEIIDSGIKNNVWVVGDELLIYQGEYLKWKIYFDPSKQTLYEDTYDAHGLPESTNEISASNAPDGSGINDVEFYYSEHDNTNTIQIVVKYNDNVAAREIVQTISLRTDL